LRELVLRALVVFRLAVLRLPAAVRLLAVLRVAVRLVAAFFLPVVLVVFLRRAIGFSLQARVVVPVALPRMRVRKHATSADESPVVERSNEP
jgi:hypothetical protein